MDYVRQQPNVRIFGFWRLNLNIYNLSNPNRDNGWNNWLRRIGTEPVIHDSLLQVKSCEQISKYLETIGYYRNSVTDTMIVTGEKRCRVEYHVNVGDIYKIGNLSINIADDSIRPLIMEHQKESLLREGDAFNANTHDKERDRLARLLNDNGYYSFSKDFIYFHADSSRQHLLVDDSLIVLPPNNSNHKIAIIDSVSFVVNGEKIHSDTFRIFRNSLFDNSCFLLPEQTYRISDVELTNSRLRSLPIVNLTQTKFSRMPYSLFNDNKEHLNAEVTIQTNKQQNYSIDLEGTNSSGNLGGALTLQYRHLNLLRGAESLDIKVRFALQNQFARDGKERFATIETGASANLSIPKMLIPWATTGFHKKHNPQTVFSISYDYQRRPDFTKSMIASQMRYTWHGSSQYVWHTLTPIELNVVSIPAISNEFKEYISRSYLQYSYQDHFIFSLAYSLMFDQQKAKKLGTTWYLRWNIESAGNALSLFTKNSSLSGDGDDQYKSLWNIRYAQYAKTDLEVRCQVTDLFMNSFVYRLFAGIGIPYENSRMLPFEKSYFCGGANSIRAWPVRGLGPGASESDPSLRYHNQTSDIRLEANAEYRFHMISILEGAVFADAGNIWALGRSTNDEKAQISKNFYKQIALGAGLGLRLNFDYFILRFDGAVKIHDPSKPDNNKGWTLSTHRFKGSDINVNFAIGYPF